MNQSLIAVRYAKALFDLAKENNNLEIVSNDIDLINSVVKESENFLQYFNSPIVKENKKEQLLKNVFHDKISIETFKFLELIINNGREEYLIDICRIFNNLYLEDKNILKVQLISAVELSDNLVQEIKQKLLETYKSEIILENIIDEKIIGGFILKVKDKQIDASVLSSLKEIRKNLTSTHYQKNI